MRLVELDEAALDALGAGEAPGGLVLPQGGIASPEILGVLRGAMVGGARTWLVSASGTAVGLCGTKSAPTGGAVEIGYGIAVPHRRLGHATAAVAALLEVLRLEGLRVAAAETEPGNLASEGVLRRVGFRPAGMRDGPTGGVRLWWRAL